MRTLRVVWMIHALEDSMSPLCRLFLLVTAAALFLGACASAASPSASSEQPQPDTREQALQHTDEDISVTQSVAFVVVSRDAPLYVQPDEQASFIQHLSAPEQTALLARQRERERAEQLKAAKADRLKRERARKLAQRRAKTKKRRRRRKRRKLTKAQRKARAEAQAKKKARARRARAQEKLKAQVKKTRAGLYVHPQQHMLVLALLGEQGDWLHVQTLTPEQESQHCWRGALSALQPAQMRFWVRRSDLQTIIKRFERFEVYRGTEIKLQPGTVLTPKGDDHYIAQVDGVRVELQVPSDVIGTSYKNPRVFEAPESDLVFKPEAFAEGLLKIDKRQRLQYSAFYDQFIVRTGQSRSHRYATTQTPCTECTVIHPDEMTEPAGRRKTRRIRGGTREIRAPFAQSGASLYLPTGQRIGRATGKMPLGQASGTHDGRPCFKQRLWAEYALQPWRALEVCVPKSQVVNTWP